MAVFAVPCAALAQRADCPVRDAAMPAKPPGKPPQLMPQATFPETWGGPVQVETGVVLPRGQDLVEAEEGHLTAIAKSAERARGAPAPAPGLLDEFVDVRKTVLSQWRFEGYLPAMPGHKVERVFSRQGSVLVFEQWNMAADGAALAATPAPTVRIGRFAGNAGGLRTPSGCVGASLAWSGDGFSYSLKMAGPEPLEAQRDILLQVARSIASATPPRR